MSKAKESKTVSSDTPLVRFLFGFLSFNVLLITILVFVDPGPLLSSAAVTPIVPIFAFVAARDFENHEIQDVSVLLISAFGAIHTALDPDRTLCIELCLALLLVGVLWVSSEYYYRLSGVDAFGIGDAKLIGALSLVVGVGQMPILLFAACIGGIAYVLLRRFLFKHQVEGAPFGPFLVIPAMWLVASHL